MGVRIIKCSCHGVTFLRLKDISERYAAHSISELRRHAQFAENCKRCVPYVLKMLESGKTEFDELLETDTIAEAPGTEADPEIGEGLYGEDEEL